MDTLNMWEVCAQVMPDLVPRFLGAQMTELSYSSIMQIMGESFRSKLPPFVRVSIGGLLCLKFDLDRPMSVCLWSNGMPVFTQSFRLTGYPVHDSIDFNFTWDGVPLRVPMEMTETSTWSN